jgi:glutamine amidotransferase
MITIVDYKVGNLGSIKNMLRKIGEQSIITSDPEEVKSANKIILPGVGAFDNGIKNLKNLDLWKILNQKVLEEKTPILGICLGAQIMTRGSEEGQEKGFGWVDADTVKFVLDKNSKLKIPSMGWNFVEILKSSKLFDPRRDVNPRFYFVHSYHFQFNSDIEVLTNSIYSYKFVSGFEKDNIVGVQFHPEKSHKYGMQLLKNFVEKY